MEFKEKWMNVSPVKHSLRECRRCGVVATSIEQLEKFKTSRKGKYGKDTICKVCAGTQTKESVDLKRQVELTKKRVRENKVKAIRYCGGVCNSCGKGHDGTNAVIFDFHHLNPKDKKMKPTKALKMSWENIKKEIDKCVLLCSNCHRLEHQQEEW